MSSRLKSGQRTVPVSAGSLTAPLYFSVGEVAQLSNGAGLSIVVEMRANPPATALLFPADELHFRADKSPGVPRPTLHYFPE